MSWLNPWKLLSSVRNWSTNHVSSDSVSDGGGAVSSQSQDTDLGGVVDTRKRALHQDSCDESTPSAKRDQGNVIGSCGAESAVMSTVDLEDHRNSQVAKKTARNCIIGIRESDEYNSLKENSNDLEIALKNNYGLVLEDLNSRGLVQSDAYDLVKDPRGNLTPREKAGCVLRSVRDMVSLNPRNYHTFVNILRKNQLYFKDIVEKLNKICTSYPSSMPTVTSPIATPAISYYSEHLKAYYNNTHFSSGNKWPPSPSKKFVTLAIVKSGNCRDKFIGYTLQGNVKEMLKKREEISMEQILEADKDHSKNKLVLIEGAPGIGKSTLAWELCRKWEVFPSMQHVYSLVVLLRLREKRVQEIQNVSDLFYPCGDKENRKSLIDEISRSHGDGVLFILDGFDELPLRCQNEGLLINLIEGSVLPKCTVLVTSRPSATANLLTKCSTQKRIEILGFTRECVEKYASSVFSSQPEKLRGFKQYISASNNPAIHSLMYVPLNAAIIASLYDSSFVCGNPLPHTLTQLYTEVCFTILRRHVMGDHPSVLIQEFKDLPGDLHQQFLELAKIAFEGFVKEEVIFHAVPPNLVQLGFLDTVSALYGVGKVSHNFLHFTLQEFFASYHISQLSDSGLELFKHHGRDKRWNVVWRFVAGLTKFKYIENCDVLSSVSFMTERDDEVRVSLPFIQCLYEAQIKIEIKSILGTKSYNTGFDYSSQLFSPLDMYALGYSIAYSDSSTSSWKVGLYISESDNSFVLGLQANNSPCTGRITELDISGEVNVKELFESYPCRAVTTLLLKYCSFDCSYDECYSTFQKIVNPSSGKLKELHISVSQRSNTTDLSLLKIFFAPSSLKSLDVVVHNQSLDESLFLCDLGTNTCLTKVSIYYTYISCLVPQIVEVLKCNKTIKFLKLGIFAYDDSHPQDIQCDPCDVVKISDALRENDTLESVTVELKYGNNRLSRLSRLEFIENKYPGVTFDRRISWTMMKDLLF